MYTEFRQLRDDELDASYKIICDATEWLLSRNIRQWTAVLPRDIWEQRQRKGENFVLTYDGELAVVLSLCKELHPYWIEQLKCDKHWWLSTLATSSLFRGRQMGRKAVCGATNLLQAEGVKELYLDCVYGQGFLPGYYVSQGFDQIARKVIPYPMGDYDMVLMKKSL